MSSLAILEGFGGYITETMALAAVALIGYLFGHRTRQQLNEPSDNKLRAELTRAVQIAKDLHQVAQRIRRDVASHQSSISEFQTRVGRLKNEETAHGWQVLSSEAETLLTPTMKLATNLSLAYDQLRKQSSQLMNFAGARSDPLTGVANRRALEEQLDVLLSLHDQAVGRFSLALLSIEPHSFGNLEEHDLEQLLQDFAKLLENSARDTDFVARYSSDEFVVLMPQTTLTGAILFSERLIKSAAAELNAVTCGGVVEVLPEDSPEKILSRAGSALYSARANGVSCLFQHNGKTIRSYPVEFKSSGTYTTADELQTVLPSTNLLETDEGNLCLNGQAAD